MVVSLANIFPDPETRSEKLKEWPISGVSRSSYIIEALVFYFFVGRQDFPPLSVFVTRFSSRVVLVARLVTENF